MVVNNVGYRQAENIWQPVEPGRNIVLTIDLAVQRKAERALQIYGAVTRGAVVVMDVQTGDLLALAGHLDVLVHGKAVVRGGNAVLPAGKRGILAGCPCAAPKPSASAFRA